MEGIILEVPKNKVRICIVYVWYFAETGRFVAVPGELLCDMVMSSNGNIFRVTDPLWGESTGDRWIPLTKASEAELRCFLLSVPEQTVEQTIEMPVIWDTIACRKQI